MSRLALLKPDFGVTGGFERVVDRVEATLRRDGHDVTRLTVEVDRLPHRTYGLDVPDPVWATVPEYFRYLASTEAFEHLDTRRFDAVISTQPPSFAHRHPRHLALFFHHHRIFYDLEDTYLAAGFSAHPDLHRRAAQHVRDLDRPALARVSWFLAGSEAVRTRLARFNQIDRVGLFHAGVGVDDAGLAPAARELPTGDGAVLCVGRFEFPKRTELVVHAAHHLPDVAFALVGTGGREAWTRLLDHRFSRPDANLSVSPEDLWCTTGQVDEPVQGSWTSNVTFLGRVGDAELERLYGAAPCVIAPAFQEDYGLTAVEAMRHGTPVVACHDGGGLATLVDHEVDGLLVEPTGPAIAAAVHRLRTDPDLRATLSAGARAKAARITWARADDQLRAGLAEVLA